MAAKQHGMPGEWAKVCGTVRSLWPLFLCFTALGASLATLVLGRHVVLFAAVFVTVLVVTAVTWRRGLRRVESFFKGARGEERVARILADLPDGFHVFHDFAFEGSHVDHVVLGPTGVYSVETKSWRGTVTTDAGEILVDGRLPDRAPLAQARREATAVKRALKRAGWEGEVTPVVCFASDTFENGCRAVGPVMVLNAREIPRWFAEQSVVLGPDEIERLAELIRMCA
jgi:hypothetical protein